jgi:hypothetical protein
MQRGSLRSSSLSTCGGGVSGGCGRFDGTAKPAGRFLAPFDRVFAEDRVGKPS